MPFFSAIQQGLKVGPGEVEAQLNVNVACCSVWKKELMGVRGENMIVPKLFNAIIWCGVIYFPK